MGESPSLPSSVEEQLVKDCTESSPLHEVQNYSTEEPEAMETEQIVTSEKINNLNGNVESEVSVSSNGSEAGQMNITETGKKKGATAHIMDQRRLSVQSATENDDPKSNVEP